MKKKPVHQKRTYHPIPEYPTSYGRTRRGAWLPGWAFALRLDVFIIWALSGFSAWLGWLYYRYWRRQNAIVLRVENQSDQPIVNAEFLGVDTYVKLDTILPYSKKAIGMPLIDKGELVFSFTRPDGRQVKTACEHEFQGRLVILPT